MPSNFESNEIQKIRCPCIIVRRRREITSKAYTCLLDMFYIIDISSVNVIAVRGGVL